jgi:Cysteine-rich secretory protein family
VAPLNVTTAQSLPEWLHVANRYRASVGVPDVVENSDASAGATAHSRYLVVNGEIGHDEDERKPAYTENGRRAGLTGNVSAGSGSVVTQRQAIETWLTVPFHGVGMLAPRSSAFGFGQYQTKKNSWAATLSLFWDSFDNQGAGGTVTQVQLMADALVLAEPWIESKGYSYNCNGPDCVLVSDSRVFVTDHGRFVEKPGADPAAAARGELGYDIPVVFPGAGSGVRYGGSEYPDPLSSCAGFREPAGLPIYILRGKPTELTEASVIDDQGIAQQLCTLSASTYRNARDLEAQHLGRAVLDSYGAVVLIPRLPLQYGRAYSVTARTTDGEYFKWSFRVTTNSAIDLPVGHVKANQPTVGLPSQPPAASRKNVGSAKPKSKGKAAATAKLPA